MNEANFAVFAFSFLLMAAGGYIINDYYDVEIDQINKPGKVIIGNQVSPSIALASYWIFTIAGLLSGCWACYKAGLYELGIVFFIYMSGLWFYTTTLKYQFLIGNLLIAFFLAIVPFTAGVIELYADVQNPSFPFNTSNFHLLFYWILAISVFAFLSSLAREIVKDMEDIEGDAKAGCHTVPIVLGINASKKIVQVLLVVIFSLFGYLQYCVYKVNDWLSFVYFSVFIQIPIIFLVVHIQRASTQHDFHKISTRAKILMVSGISYLFVFAYMLLR